MLEVRNTNPLNNAINVPVDADIFFDIVGVSGDTVDSSTISVEVETVSKIDTTTSSIIYTPISNRMIVKEIVVGLHYEVYVNPAMPFDLSQAVTVKVNADTALSVAMTEFSFLFRTFACDVLSLFEMTFLESARNIPIYNELLRPNSTTAPTEYDAAFGRWQTKPTPIVRINKVITTTGFTIDYQNGKILFASALDYNDRIDVDYNFRYFNDIQISQFLNMANTYWIVAPPTGGAANIFTARQHSRNVVFFGAAMIAYQRLVVDLAFQEKRLIFDNHSWGDDWKEAKNIWKEAASFYKEVWDQLLDAKRHDLPPISSVVTPEFTLPGGRSRMFRYLYKSGSGA